ncbi:LysR family transcriptional regulator [Candidatus Igneacidithiobacillus taiwanensis]|uniref:LysR family transcriptional regulator n=1 Tax=Candidatus Igneacidithiobacillus taiwanensis TaxID=1945924 RepID=UPI002899843B|nr:LysR family transcriptional regulator [Candidatus Igneacidithiobacillus taiwanensis]MCE5359911.1 LysR family transcriptional regulator [Acidithiobacillus sp.]
MKLHPEDLLSFLAVAEEGGVARAADRLHCSQPTVSGRLQRLQLALGEALYLREGRGIRLSPAGESLLPLLRRLRADLQQIEDWVSQRQQQQEGQLRIAASSTVANYFLMEHLARFRARYPGIELRLQTGALALEDLDWHDWDLLFTEEAIVSGTLPAHLEQVPWREDELVAILPRQHPWARAGKKSASWAEILAQPIVWREPHSGIRRRVEAALSAAGLKPSYTVEVTGVEALREAVAAGLGIGFASVEALDKVRWPLASLRLEPPKGLFWTLYLVHPRAEYGSHALRAFLDLLLPQAGAQDSAKRTQAP